MTAIYVIVIMILVLASYHLTKLFVKMIKEIMETPIKGAAASLKGMKRLNAKRRLARYNRACSKEAAKQLKEHAISSLKSEQNGFVKTDKIKNLESKLK